MPHASELIVMGHFAAAIATRINHCSQVPYMPQFSPPTQWTPRIACVPLNGIKFAQIARCHKSDQKKDIYCRGI